jgi:signal transduction histidine kinase
MSQKNNSPRRARARRFSMRVPLRYRGIGTWEWRNGETENISFSGVLFRCPEQLEERARVEVVLEMPPELSEGAGLDLLCAGQVVRSTEAGLLVKGGTIAVAFKDFRLLQRQGQQEQAERQSLRDDAVLRPEVRHKLNNQIAIIVGTCELLMQGAILDEEFRKRLQQIRDATERAAALIREL